VTEDNGLPDYTACPSCGGNKTVTIAGIEIECKTCNGAGAIPK
jgi:DnaJ-class molecular chaperone